MGPVIDHKTHEVRYGGVLGRCNSIEGRFMRQALGLSHEEIEAVMLSPAGPVIVGQDPGPNTSDVLPMFPHPETSAGGRMLRYSGMTAFDYLRTFSRVNLMTSHTPSWRVTEARAAAVRLLARFDGHPLVLLGSRVAEAFRAEAHVSGHQNIAGCPVLLLPHPSGRNLEYNTPAARRRARLTLWDAVDLWHHPVRASTGATDAAGDWAPSPRVTRRSCEQCGRLAQAHPAHGGDPTARVLCSGVTPRIVRPYDDR